MDILTVKDVAKMLGCSESLIRRAYMKAALGAFVVGERGIRFHRDKIDAYIARKTVKFVPADNESTKSNRRKARNLTSSHGLW
jgi:excisionase family DNA binding protein